MMKTIAKLLVVVTELAIRCRASLYWHSFEQHSNDYLAAWSGEDNLILTEKTATSASLGSDPHLQFPRPNHASSSHSTSSTAPTSEPLPHRTDLAGIHFHRVIEDHVLRLVDSPPPHDIDSSPMEIDPPPSMETDSPLMEIDSSPKELEEKITQPDVGAAVDHHHIHIREKEVPVYRLVFRKDVFSVPLCDGQPCKFKWQQDFEAMVDAVGGGQTLPPVLVVTCNARAFITGFNSLSCSTQEAGDKKGVRYTGITERQITTCLDNSMTWKAVYHRRLGIDFEGVEEWFQRTVEHESPTSTGDTLLPKLNQWFLLYIILVDMIITVLPNGYQNEQPVNRIQCFQSAVRCFEDYTKLTLRTPKRFGNSHTKMRLSIVWRFITFWKDNHSHYAALYLPPSHFHLLSWRKFFNLLFAYSIDKFTQEFKSALFLSKASR